MAYSKTKLKISVMKAKKCRRQMPFTYSLFFITEISAGFMASFRLSPFISLGLGGSLSPEHGASSGCGWRDGLQLWRVAVNTLNK
jgi:hypothetical protein